LEVATGQGIDLTQPADVLPSRPLWSPDGTELLYQSLDVNMAFALTRLVFSRPGGGAPDYRAKPHRIVDSLFFPIDLGAATQRPAWNPAGDHLVFVMYTPFMIPPGFPGYTYKTWVMGVDGSSSALLLPTTRTMADCSATWSPDGSWLAQWSWDTEGKAGVWLVNPAGTEAIELTAALGGDALYPAWSADGRMIAFASNRSGQFDIWLADVARVTGSPLGVEQP
jgi:Tol biopolymer transport system component